MPFSPEVHTRGALADGPFCSACGAHGFASDAFCVDCGAQLRPPGGLSPGREPAPTSKPTVAAAVALLSHGRPVESACLLEGLLAEDPGDAVARAYLGLAYLRMTRVADARVELEEAVRLAPDSFICRTKLAEFFARLGFFDKAVHHLDVALAGRTPDTVSELAARELRTFCHEKGKGLFYRPTAAPSQLRLSNFLPKRLQAKRLAVPQGSVH